VWGGGDVTPRYDGTSENCEEIPGYVSQYLAGGGGEGMGRSDETLRYDNYGDPWRGGGGGKTGSDSPADTHVTNISQFSRASSRASTRPKIAFGRRVAETHVPGRGASVASTNLSYSRPSTANSHVRAISQYT